MCGGVVGYSQREGGLSNARPRSHDDQVALLQAAGHLVEVVEAGGDANHAAGAVLDRFDAVVVFVEDLLDGGEVFGGGALGDGEEDLLGLVEHGGRLFVFRVAQGCDLAARRDEAAQHRRALHYMSVILDVDRGGGVVYQLDEVAVAADVLKLARTL